MNARGRDEAWIAAQFDNVLPQDFELGDSIESDTGYFVNRPLTAGQPYKIFVRAITTDSVRPLISILNKIYNSDKLLYKQTYIVLEL